MTFRELLHMLEAEHRRRYGDVPDAPWHRWLWEPWVGEFLRAYRPMRLAVARRTKP